MTRAAAIAVLIVGGCGGNALSTKDALPVAIPPAPSECAYNLAIGPSRITGAVPYCSGADISNCCHAVSDSSIGGQHISVDIRSDAFRWAFGEYPALSHYALPDSQMVVELSVQPGVNSVCDSYRGSVDASIQDDRWSMHVTADGCEGIPVTGTVSGGYSEIIPVQSQYN